MVEKYITNSEQETFKLAKKFAKTLKGGETLCLIGDLGSGKTAFVKGLAKGLGVDNIITSPTFVLMKVYNIPVMEKAANPSGAMRHLPLVRGELVHIDVYRLSNGADLEAIGVKDYFNNPSAIVVIEWADRVRAIWPQNCLEINFQTLAGDEREIKIKK